MRFIFLLLSFCLSFLNSLTAESVLVSVAPHRYFVKRVAGDTVDVMLLVPVGASSHTFEPSPRQMIEASRADLWFLVGENFEKKALSSLNVKGVDLRKGLSLLEERGCSCCSNGADPHIWMSVQLAKIQVETIANALSEAYPSFKRLYEENAKAFIAELDVLDQELQSLLADRKERPLLVSHPAYGYLCRDYGLTQLSIEFEGRDPTPQILTRLLQTAREKRVRTLFTQPQYSAKGAHLIAKELKSSGGGARSLRGGLSHHHAQDRPGNQSALIVTGF